MAKYDIKTEDGATIDTNTAPGSGNIFEVKKQGVVIAAIDKDGVGTGGFASGSGSDEKADDVFRVIGSVDATKKIAFEADGITTATTRTVTMPDKDIDLDDVNTLKMTRLATAVSATTSGESIVGVTDTTAARTITLATADVIAGKIIIIKDESGNASTGGNPITIDTEGSELIDGVASVQITADYGVVRLYSDGTNWFSI